MEYIVDGQIYDLNIKVHEPTNDDNDDLAQIITDFKPQGELFVVFSLSMMLPDILEDIQLHSLDFGTYRLLSPF